MVLEEKEKKYYFSLMILSRENTNSCYFCNNPKKKSIKDSQTTIFVFSVVAVDFLTNTNEHLSSLFFVSHRLVVSFR